jgi:hypothetical protein
MASMPAFNDDEGRVVLLSAKVRIDEFTYNAEMHSALIKNQEGVSLERSSFTRSANYSNNFRSAAASSGYATPGYKNSQSAQEVSSPEEVFVSRKTFSPDNDGFEDILELNYKFKDAGRVANIHIYNDRGILIKKLCKNLSLAGTGSLYWDGLNEANTSSPPGIYLLYIETFDLQGNVQKYKRSFVLASKLK